jgi:chromosomal replication initiation ATPase DnaA
VCGFDVKNGIPDTVKMSPATKNIDNRLIRRSNSMISANMTQGRCVLNMLVCRTFSVGERDLLAKTRCQARAAFARQVAMYLAHTSCGLSLTDVGALFGRDRTTVAHGCAVIEDGRDAPWLDQTLAILEQCLRLAFAGYDISREKA